MITTLGPEHVSQVEQLLGQFREAQSSPTVHFASPLERFAGYFLSADRQPTAVAHGLWRGDELRFVVASLFSTDYSTWRLYQYFGQPDVAPDETRATLEHLHRFAEARGYWRYYAVAPVYERRFFHDPGPRYAVYLDTIVPANTKAMFSSYFQLLGLKVWQTDVAVWLSQLRRPEVHTPEE